MFPWSAVFSLEPKVPGRRSSSELVTNTLMLELGAQVKRTERIHLERLSEGRRSRSSSTADYSWLATAHSPAHYELSPGDLLELQELCAKVPPPQCGPLIVRFRRLVSQMEPEVHEVVRLFRTLLHDGVEEHGGEDAHDALAHVLERQQRSKSLSSATRHSWLHMGQSSKGRAVGGSRGNLTLEQHHMEWSDEEETEDIGKLEDTRLRARVARKNRSRSMPDISPMEHSGHR
ncbi:hypothetical protein NHX12_011146 [Muraenolepis orangiensis]|uniref:Protein RD3-like n=1 Tax=Muraenolepis orangiensis TaxID=630683 RepID=A0A9Q0DFN0_9TELE|nr:hypothetical protein NHX12_011146 [Muraenolepis orangiensis]